jgi:hypothetical protein
MSRSCACLKFSPAWILQNEKRFGGCRSWIDLPPPSDLKMNPVLNNAAHEKLRAQFDQMVSSS